MPRILLAGSGRGQAEPLGREGRQPLVLGHRGASFDAPENTVAAFRLAMALGADGVELDVWRCGSGEVVVHHDRETFRTAGRALRVDRAPLSALRALEVGSHKGERFRGERIPLLAEVLEALPGAALNVELKAQGIPDLGLAAAVARLLTRAGATDRCVVSSFNLTLLAAFRALAPAVATGLLFEAGRSGAVRAAVGTRLLGLHAVHPQAVLVTPGRAARWARRGLRVNVWTVDAPAEAARLADLGVNALITNRPAEVRAALRSARASAPVPLSGVGASRPELLGELLRRDGGGGGRRHPRRRRPWSAHLRPRVRRSRGPAAPDARGARPRVRR